MPEVPETWYGLVDEERKININSTKSAEILQRLFEQVGMSRDDARDLADGIRAWKSENGDESLSGAGKSYYQGLTPPYVPRNGNFTKLEELLWVKGMTPEFYVKLLPYVTLESSGRINLNTAPREVLMAVGLFQSVCDKIIIFRKGPDGMEGTKDDYVFDNEAGIAESLANVGFLNDNERSNLEALTQNGMLAVKSQNFKAQVLAQQKNKTQALRTTAVFDEKGVIKQWEEEFVVS